MIDLTAMTERAAKYVAALNGHSDDWERFIHEAADYVSFIHADAIERLTRERDAAERKVERLREALVNVLVDIDDYERRNKLAPSPGKPDCWQSVTSGRWRLSNEGRLAALAETEQE